MEIGSHRPARAETDAEKYVAPNDVKENADSGWKGGSKWRTADGKESADVRPSQHRAEAKREAEHKGEVRTPLAERDVQVLVGDRVQEGSNGILSKLRSLPGSVIHGVTDRLFSKSDSVSESASAGSLTAASATATEAPPAFDRTSLVMEKSESASQDQLEGLRKLMDTTTADFAKLGIHITFDKDCNRSDFWMGGQRCDRAESAQDQVRKDAIFDALANVTGGDVEIAKRLTGLAEQGAVADAMILATAELQGSFNKVDATNQIHVDANSDGTFTVLYDHMRTCDHFSGEEVGMQKLDEPVYFRASVAITVNADGTDVISADQSFSTKVEPDVEFYEHWYGDKLSTDQSRIWSICEGHDEINLRDFVEVCIRGELDDTKAHALLAGHNIPETVAMIIANGKAEAQLVKAMGDPDIVNWEYFQMAKDAGKITPENVSKMVNSGENLFDAIRALAENS